MIKRQLGHFIIVGFALVATACNFTVTNDIVKSHPEEVETFSKSMLQAFYRQDSDILLKNFDDSVSVESDALLGLFEISHESALVDKSVDADRSFKRVNNRRHYVTEFHIPRERGREVLTVTVSQDGEFCCTLSGIHLKPLLGQSNLMDESPLMETSDSD